MATRPAPAPTPSDLSRLCLVAIEHAPAPMATVEGAGHIVCQVNPAFCRLMDQSKEQLVGKSFYEILPKNDGCITLLDRVYRTGMPECHTEQQHSEPHPVYWSYAMWPVMVDGRPLGVMIQVTETAQLHEEKLAMNEALMLGSVRQHELTEAAESLNAQLQQEINERKRAQADMEELESTNRQLQKSESLGRMAGAIAHTFNNQLGVVIGNLELALLDLPSGGAVDSLTAAKQAAEKAATVSSQMLTYLGQSIGKRELFDLSEVCRRNLPILRAALPGKVLLEIDLPSPGPVITADANQIAQVLTNLINNAWEAVGEAGGSIHLTVKTVLRADIPTEHRRPVYWQPEDPAYACIEVVDVGCGIADKEMENLFDPFFSSKFAGRGMGLPVVMGILKAHGGAVTVKSEAGQGSTFRIFLPLSAGVVPQRQEKASHLQLGANCTVLLVEDDTMMRNMASTMLRRLGLTVLEAKDGAEAIEVLRARQNEIRCVLCDLTMPYRNGWETIAALHEIAPDVPVILASGYDKARVMSGDHSEWPQVFLGKPYGFEALRDAIGKALGSWNEKK
jgi:two-component system, cell cycle sensor histidine kinase and response regulator CckA